MTTDHVLFLWDYTDPRGNFYQFDGLDQTIIHASLVRPRRGVFEEGAFTTASIAAAPFSCNQRALPPESPPPTSSQPSDQRPSVTMRMVARRDHLGDIGRYREICGDHRRSRGDYVCVFVYVRRFGTFRIFEILDDFLDIVGFYKKIIIYAPQP